MSEFNRAIKLIFLSFFCYAISSAQSITVVSHPDSQPLPDVNISLDGKNIGFTDSKGKFKLNSIGNELVVSYVGYITQLLPTPKKDTSILLIPVSILLAEVIISPPKEKIIGYFGTWGNGVIYGKPVFNSSVVNSMTIAETTKLKSFLFYIPNFPNSTVNVPFEFVLYKEVNGKFLASPSFHPVRIDRYDFLWNSFSLADKDIQLEPGNYLFGMRWIRTDTNRKDSSIRQALGTINKGKTQVSSYRSTPDKGWQILSTAKDGVTIYSIAMLGLIVDR
ncbi:MAG: carboxypeptidase-like regulatory domain-containing protein [Flavobacterium sp.]|nr:MAG: carboxypeptidase-like regulatory domain-containing protein [Flavobacterium sp.]